MSKFEKYLIIIQESEPKKNWEKTLIGIGKKIEKKLHCDRFGSCVHFAEMFCEEVLKNHSELLEKFKIVEVWVTIKNSENVNEEQAHTYIKLNSGKKIDPTRIQFENDILNEKIEKEYKAEDYLKAMEKDRQNLKYSYLGQRPKYLKKNKHFKN